MSCRVILEIIIIFFTSPGTHLKISCSLHVGNFFSSLKSVFPSTPEHLSKPLLLCHIAMEILKFFDC